MYVKAILSEIRTTRLHGRVVDIVGFFGMPLGYIEEQGIIWNKSLQHLDEVGGSGEPKSIKGKIK